MIVVESAFCCEQFIQRLKNAGEKELAFIPKEDDGTIYFVMQFRNMGSNEKEGVLTIMQTAIKFCPYCGVNLNIIIKVNYAYIYKLAQEQKQIIL